MLNGKIEKGVPLPPQSRTASTFHRDYIAFLDKLGVGDSVLFHPEQRAYILETKARLTAKIYGIVKDRDFTLKLDVENSTVRIWRVR